MMRLKPFLKNLVRHGLNIFFILCLILGCSSSTQPTYLKENISESIQKICKNEYQIDVKVTLVGETLWIYLAVEDMFVKSEKPQKYSERFAIEHVKDKFHEGLLKLAYMIRPIPENEKYQAYKYNKEVLNKINNVWKVLRRVIFSIDRLKTGEPKFFCLIVADIKNAFETKDIFYYLDLKKVSYEFISWNEYQHRTIQETNVSPQIFGDKEGRHLVYEEITLQDFIAGQIGHRIKLKFQKSEVDSNADIDKEILKIVVYTLKTYEFKDFTTVELENLLTDNKTILNQAEVWASFIK